jgi:transcriptional regulator with XRE-family HTH domain
MDSLKLLGNEIRRRRLEMAISQEELAAICNLHRTYIGSVERGERNISLYNIIAIASALRCKPSMLLICVDGSN